MMELMSILYDVYVRHVSISSVLSLVDFGFSLLCFLLKVEKLASLKLTFLVIKMPFVEKQHCKTAHVLLSKACPLHNVPHKICEYPLSSDRNPIWLLYPASHYRENLDCLTVVQLQESVWCVDQFPPRLITSV